MSLLRTPLLLLLLLQTAEQPVRKLPVGKDTTYFTGPLDKDGYIDYEAALNDRLGQGITPENNANVLLWKAFGPRPDGGDRMPAEFFKRLGMEEPPERGDYFIGLRAKLMDNLKRGLDVNGGEPQLDRAIKRVWTAKDNPLLAAWVKSNEKPLAVVVEAASRPAYYNPLIAPKTASGPGGLAGASLGSVLKCREFAKALVARAMLRAGEGKLDDAWQDLLACHRLGRLVARGGTLIDAQVGIAIGQIASSADLAYLDCSGLTAKQAQAALQDLQKLTPLAPLADRIDLGDRCMFLDFVQEAHRHGLINPAGIVADAPARKPTPAEQKVFASLEWGIVLRTGNHWYDRVAAILRIRKWERRQEEIDRFLIDLKDLKEQATNSAALRKEIAQGAEPGKALGTKLGGILVSSMLQNFTQVQDGADREEQMQRNLQLAFALAIYQREHGRYPAKLDELAPKYLPALEGLFSEKALIYRRLARGYLLYSVGANGRDEEGRGIDDNPPGDDLGIGMPLPELKQKR